MPPIRHAQARRHHESRRVHRSGACAGAHRPQHARCARNVSPAPLPPRRCSGSLPLVHRCGDCSNRSGLAACRRRYGMGIRCSLGLVGHRVQPRIESILESQDGMWADAAARRRCIVAVRAFFETHRSETALDKTTGKSAKRQYAFERADGEPLFLAAVHEKGRFALVTAKPCACVADVHNRMPLVLNTQEAARWLDGRYADLADRSQVPLRAKPED